MLVLVWLSLLMALLLIVLLPVLFAGIMAVSLTKLHLSPGIALLLVLAVIIGGFINIPIRRLLRHRGNQSSFRTGPARSLARTASIQF